MLERIRSWWGRPRRSGAELVIGSTVAAFTVLAAIAMSLWQYREEVEAHALLTGRARVASVEAQLRARFESYDAALRLIIANFSDPTLRMLDNEVWARLLSNIQNSDSGIDSITIIGSGGQVLAKQSASADVDYAKLPFFRAHQASAAIGLLISDPEADNSGRQMIVLSRRMALADGKFGGVTALVIDLAAIRGILQPIPMDSTDSVAVVSGNGRIIARKPALADNGDAGVDLTRNANFQRMQLLGHGSFVSRSSLDGVERLITFDKVEGTRLIVSAGIATDSLYGNWRRQSLLIGGLALAISSALVFAALLLLRESRLRAAAQSELERQARTDFLTGLPNRRQFEMSLHREWRRAARTRTDLAVILFDADNFKGLNDKHGHAIGDEMLKLVAGVLDEAARRPGDLPARIGGEEFAMVLADTTAEGAAFVAERIRSDLEARSLSDHGGIRAVTLSAGVAATLGGAAGSATALLAAADAALYLAKQNGRDRVQVHQPA
ncbi:diguanylate cyclase (GGDEF) domain-containing protein [Kaistia soli DSM 19436]|uniref:diguanylate cyclase n=1 Tax=Kaistia soli DSM 19436 TaxID=1122133 RepID=A0A1M5KZX0_9HYPH|nr:sensor domain-containing diguanylate cyclase [Kaistia soli]SHG58348.1 diguanylate cyclase (GGDEF) domain-containing protein [Kaistia soli DSM 19436]